METSFRLASRPPLERCGHAPLWPPAAVFLSTFFRDGAGGRAAFFATARAAALPWAGEGETEAALPWQLSSRKKGGGGGSFHGGKLAFSSH